MQAPCRMDILRQTYIACRTRAGPGCRMGGGALAGWTCLYGGGMPLTAHSPSVQVCPNETVRGVVAEGANVLPARVVEDAFASMHGATLNFKRLQAAIAALDNWYHERGILGLVRVQGRARIDQASCTLFVPATPHQRYAWWRNLQMCGCVRQLSCWRAMDDAYIYIAG